MLAAGLQKDLPLPEQAQKAEALALTQLVFIVVWCLATPLWGRGRAAVKAVWDGMLARTILLSWDPDLCIFLDIHTCSCMFVRARCSGGPCMLHAMVELSLNSACSLVVNRSASQTAPWALSQILQSPCRSMQQGLLREIHAPECLCVQGQAIKLFSLRYCGSAVLSSTDLETRFRRDYQGSVAPQSLKQISLPFCPSMLFAPPLSLSTLSVYMLFLWTRKPLKI